MFRASFPVVARYMFVTARPKARRISLSSDSDLILRIGGCSILLGCNKRGGRREGGRERGRGRERAGKGEGEKGERGRGCIHQR